MDVGVSQRYLAQAVDLPYKAKGEILPSDLGNDAFVFKRPMGVMCVFVNWLEDHDSEDTRLSFSFVMSPWNAPLGLTFSTTLPALAAGNTVVLKTSEITPECQLIAAEIFKEVDARLLTLSAKR